MRKLKSYNYKYSKVFVLQNRDWIYDYGNKHKFKACVRIKL